MFLMFFQTVGKADAKRDRQPMEPGLGWQEDLRKASLRLGVRQSVR